MASIMAEKDKFEAIRDLYNSGGIPKILSDQQIKVNELQIRKLNLQTKAMGKFYLSHYISLIHLNPNKKKL